jgi:hypothetical protein
VFLPVLPYHFFSSFVFLPSFNFSIFSLTHFYPVSSLFSVIQT